ncbi:MAG: type II toxin-antitoxin system mRNA interferase toxin, RelE/StbE family [bacterium]
MRIEYSDEFKKQYKHLPRDVRDRARKQLALFLENPRHPSLQSKKLKGIQGIWQARITHAYRFTFQIEGDLYRLLHIFHHE